MISSAQNKVVYELGEEDVYPFPLRFFEVSDIHVFIDNDFGEIELQRGIQYSVEPKEDYSDGANITLLDRSAIKPGDAIVIMRVLPLTQELNLPDQGKLPSSALETALDRLIMICQQLTETTSRAITWLPGQNPGDTPKEMLLSAIQSAKDCYTYLHDTRVLNGEMQQDIAAAKKETVETYNTLSADMNALISDTRSEIKELADTARLLHQDTAIQLQPYVWDPVHNAYTDDDVAANKLRWQENQDLINSVPRNLGGHTLTLELCHIHFPTPEMESGTFNEYFLLDGFYNGKVVVNGGVYGGINSYDVGEQQAPLVIVKNCHAQVDLVGVDFRGSALCAVYAENSPAVNFRGCRFYGHYSITNPDFGGGAVVVLKNANAILLDNLDSADAPITYGNIIAHPEHLPAPVPVRILDDAQIRAIVSTLELEEGNDQEYTSFDVYPNSAPIAANTAFTALPAALTEGMPEEYYTVGVTGYAIAAASTHKFTIRSYHPKTNIDVYVDWGDGSVEYLKDIADASVTTPLSTEAEYNYAMSHTYVVPDKKYKVKIYGENYFAIAQASENTNNILCGCFGSDNRVAAHLSNLSSFACYAYRLLYVDFNCYSNIQKALNVSNLFLQSRNLYAAVGFSRLLFILSCSKIFSTCRRLAYTDFRLPVAVGMSDGYQDAFCDCLMLAVDINTLLPESGFAVHGKFSARSLFRNCKSLTGTIPAYMLWNNPDIEWELVPGSDGSQLPFYQAYRLLSQVPASWGGEASDDVIAGTAGLSKVVNTNSTTVTLAVKGNTTYVYKNTLTRLTISSVETSVQESTIYFTAGSSITVTLPASVKTIGSMSFSPNKSYVISIKDGVAVSAEVV